jgi:hypothetical protein
MSGKGCGIKVLTKLLFYLAIRVTTVPAPVLPRVDVIDQFPIAISAQDGNNPKFLVPSSDSQICLSGRKAAGRRVIMTTGLQERWIDRIKAMMVDRNWDVRSPGLVVHDPPSTIGCRMWPTFPNFLPSRKSI